MVSVQNFYIVIVYLAYKALLVCLKESNWSMVLSTLIVEFSQ